MTSTAEGSVATGGDVAHPAGTGDAGRRWALRRWWGDTRARQWLAVLVPVAVLVAMAWERRWMADDGFIHLRVVDQVIHGNGPVFNVGERVEASTSPLWIGLLTVLSPAGGLGLPWKAVFAGIILTAVGMVAAQRAAQVLARAAGDASTVWPVGAVAVAALPPFWDYATSGLETGLAFGWLGASCWWTAARATRATPPSRRAEVAGAVLVGLGFSIRPDLALFTVAFGAVLVAARWSQGWRARAATAAAVAAVPVANQVFRMGYYAQLVPNTALAKEAGVAQWASGWRYLTDLATPYALWLPVAAAAALTVRLAARDVRRDARLAAAARLAPLAAAGVHALYITRVGGDFMHARLLLPAVFATLAPLGHTLRPAPAAAWARPGWRLRWAHAAAAAIAAWAVVAAALLRPTYTPSGTGTLSAFTTGVVIEDERRVYQELTGMENPVRADVRAWWVGMRRGLAPERSRFVAVVVDDGLGLVTVPLDPDHPAEAAGWFAPPAYTWGPDVYYLDIGGLAHPVGGHLDMLEGERVGHQKVVSLPWQLAGMTPVRVARGDDGDVLVTRDDLAAANRAISCGALGDYLEDVRAPLTPARFLGNLVDSVANTRLRVPPDPHEAEAAFCGTGGSASG